MNLILVNVDDCKVGQKLIKRGKGENECLNVSDIVLGLNEDHFFAFDITLRTCLRSQKTKKIDHDLDDCHDFSGSQSVQ